MQGHRCAPLWLIPISLAHPLRIDRTGRAPTQRGRENEEGVGCSCSIDGEKARVKRRLGPSGDGHGGHVLRPINLESDHAHGYLRWDGSYTQARTCLGDRKVIRKVSAAYGMSDRSRAPGHAAETHWVTKTAGSTSVGGCRAVRCRGSRRCLNRAAQWCAHRAATTRSNRIRGSCHSDRRQY